MSTIHPGREPKLEALFRRLAERDVRYVVTGSVAAMLHGVELSPGDLDVTPSIDTRNLKRLSELLIAIEATPAAFGHWESTPAGEKRWIEQATSDRERLAWRPDPADPGSMDHLFHTQLGNFDVVPELAGTYDELIKTASTGVITGLSVRIAHIDELLCRLTVPRRTKDRDRVVKLREIQRTCKTS